MAGAQNAIIGDDAGYGLDLPDTASSVGVDPATANMARFSKSKEFQALKDKIESRIEYYKGYQPGGDGQTIPLRDMSNEERGWRYLAADLLITEFQAIILAYELAADEVRGAATQQKTTG